MAERLAYILKKRDKTAADLARATKKTESAVSQWLSGETKSMRSDSLMASCALLSCNPQWLASGQGPMEPGTATANITLPGITVTASGSNQAPAVSTAWIDHELTLGLGRHMKDANKLANMAVTAQKHEVIQQSAIAKWMALARENPQQASDMFQSIPEHHEITIAFAELVAQRLNGLGTRIVSRFPQPNDLLSGL